MTDDPSKKSVPKLSTAPLPAITEWENMSAADIARITREVDEDLAKHPEQLVFICPRQRLPTEDVVPTDPTSLDP